MVRGSIDEQTELIRVRELLSNFMAQQGLDMSEIVQHWATIVAVLEVMVQRIAGTMEYWSDIQPGVQIAAIAADVSLPSLPPATGALGLDQVHRVTFMMRFRSLNNPSVDPNRLDGEQVIQFSADEGDTWHNALVLPDEALESWPPPAMGTAWSMGTSTSRRNSSTARPSGFDGIRPRPILTT